MSNEKQFEDIENKLKKALQNGEHAFNEEAWTKMEALLDGEDKKRRPIIWFWLLPILLIGIIALFKFTGNKTTENTVGNNATSVSKEKANPSPEKINDANIDSAPDKQTNYENIRNRKDEKGQPLTNTNQAAEQASNTAKDNIRKAKQKELVSPQADALPITVNNTNTKRKVRKSKSYNITRGLALNEIPTGNVGNKRRKKKKDDPAQNVSSLSESSSLTEADFAKDKDNNQHKRDSDGDISPKQPVMIESLKDTLAKEENAVAEKKKVATSQKSSRGFYLLGAFGADAGSTKLMSYKKSTVVSKLGFAIGYQFSNRLSVQTGFFTSNKRYSAAGGDYHVKPGSYWSNYKITAVDAVCKVYEIPLSVRYDITGKRSLSYYVMAGVSSYIMKREDYDYYYLNWGTPAEKSYGYTGNKHLFSNANIAFGIEKKISKLVSLQLEPSISVPVKGVGEGKVNLYSTSLMIGLKYLPFKK